MTADGTARPPTPPDDVRTAGHGVRGDTGPAGRVDTAGHDGRVSFGERLGQTGRKVVVTLAVVVGVVLAFVIGQYLFANSWTTHVTRTVNHSTFHGFWYGGWFAFVSVLIAAGLVRLAFVRRLNRVVRIVAAVLALVVLVPELYTIGISLSESRSGTNAGRIHNDAPGYIGGQYTGMALALAVAVTLLVLRRRWRKDRVLAREAKATRTAAQARRGLRPIRARYRRRGRTVNDMTRTRGEFVRQPYRFTDEVTADGSSGYPVESGRYHLVVSLACPWAHRAIIVRGLLGLDRHLSMSVVDPIRDARGWRFGLSADGRDPVSGAQYLAELYAATDRAYAGRVTVPTLWDTRTRRVVSNDFPRLTTGFETEWAALHAPGAPDLYPAALREQIDAVNAEVYAEVNNGVYRAGFATTQEAYREAYDRLFARLDALSERLSGQRYLVGEAITEADVRLFTTLVRFDAVYHGHFKCNRQKLTELPVLWAYARDLYQTPGFGDTVDFDHIKRHYYATHDTINPPRIVPAGPDESGWLTPHGRG
jgi:putative glutathione S-transferase